MSVSSVLLILPHQLYPRSKSELSNYKHIYCIEEPVLFTGASGDLQVHQLKIAYMRASLKWYCNAYLSSSVKSTSTYVEFSDAATVLKSLKREGATVHLDDPMDIHILEKYTALFRSKLICQKGDSPLFLAKQEQLDLFYKEHATGKKEKEIRKQVSHAAFYDFMKTQFKVLENIPSTDQENRQRLPSQHQAKSPVKYDRGSLARYYEEAIQYTQQHPVFKKHVGSANNLPLLPITHQDANKHLTSFVVHKLKHYGSYQDAIHDSDPFVYHSFISFLLNNGLLSPAAVMKRVIRARVPMNSKEGFVRQLLGWREYMRFIYVYYGAMLHKELGIGRRSAGKLEPGWYKGTTGVEPYDREVAKVSLYAFSHHIVRLMVFLNLMKLYNCKPVGIYKWFMEMVALDAYDWVMVSNIAAMGHWGHPKFMRRPYLSTSNYIKKMSNYKEGPWSREWDERYRAYVKQHGNDEGMGFYKR